MKDTIHQFEITGLLDIVLLGPNGEIKDVRHEKNIITTAGKEYLAGRMANNSTTAMSHMAIGTNNTVASESQTALIAEVARVGLTGSTGSASGAVATFAATFGAGVGTGAITEAGIFSASSSGTMLNRAVFSVINKAAGDSLSINWTVTFA